MRPSWSVAVLSALLALGPGVTAQRGEPSGTSHPPVRLAPGEEVSLRDGALALRFLRVVSDSRCPRGAKCIRAGEAEVAVTVTPRGSAATEATLSTARPVQRLVVASWEIALVGVDPYPVLGRTPAPDAYRATFAVRPRQTP